MNNDQVFPVPEAWARRAHMAAAGYDAAWKRVESDPDGFWREVAGRLDWIKPFNKVKDVSFHAEDFHIRWFEGGVLNVSANCLDRHLPHRANDIAIIWEGEPGEIRTLTYQQLLSAVSRCANVLKSFDVKKGDRVAIYMGMSPELAIAIV